MSNKTKKGMPKDRKPEQLLGLLEDERLGEIFKRYKVKIGKECRTIRHATYHFKTLLDPNQVAIWEAAFKACYVAHQVYNKNHDMRQFMGCMLYHQSIAEENGDFGLPYIANGWTDEKGQ